MAVRRLLDRTFIAAALLAGLTTACASSSSLRTAERAEQLRDYDLAIAEYTKAVRERPDDVHIRAALARARLRGAQAHFAAGRRLAGQGKFEAALVEFQIAGELNPASVEIETEVRETRQRVRTKFMVAAEGKTELETLVEQSRRPPPLGFETPADAKIPESLVFREAASRDVFVALARFADFSIAFDPAFRDQPVTVEFRKKTFEEALTTLAATTRTFVRLTAPRTLTIVPDTPAKRREYEEEVVQTFFLSNADLKESIDLLRIVAGVRQIAPSVGTNAITLKDTPERVAAAGRILSAIDKARPEVVINVEVLEVDRSKLKEYGLQIASPGQPGISGSIDANRPDMTLEDLMKLTPADVFVANLPGLYYRLLKTDGNTRTLASPHLRTTEGVAAQARFGDRVPIPNTTFAPIATGGVNQQPITSFTYENIGVNIDITPRAHHNDEVSLALRVEVSSVSGTGFGGLPTFGNRSINTVIRLRDGETNILAGLIRDQERTILRGVPGLSDLPLVGRMFAYTQTEKLETDIVLTLTPHLVRVLRLTEADLRAFRVGRDAAGGGVIDLPLPVEPPRPEPTPTGAPFPQPTRPPVPVPIP
jgi:general secretion pathway protein D